MKRLFSIKSLVTMTLLMLLLLSTFASTTMLVYAPKIKVDNVFIYGSGSVELMGKSGKTQTYSSNGSASLGGLDTIAFIPTRGWNITGVFIDGGNITISDEDGFSLTVGKVRNSISVWFVPNDGMDDVGTGSNVESNPTPEVFLIFKNVKEEGDAYAYTYDGVPIWYPSDLDVAETWDITTTADFDQNVTVILVVSLASIPGINASTLKLWGADVEVAHADVNIDGVVNGDDVSDVANANPSEPGDPLYHPRLDVTYPYGVIDDEDVNFVNNYNGQSVWEDITVFVDVDLDAGFAYVFGDTEHFSLFHGF